jgi:hypothetical protein
MRMVIQPVAGEAEEEPIVELLTATTTLPGTAWAPIRVAHDRRDVP